MYVALFTRRYIVCTRRIPSWLRTARMRSMYEERGKLGPFLATHSGKLFRKSVRSLRGGRRVLGTASATSRFVYRLNWQRRSARRSARTQPPANPLNTGTMRDVTDQFLRHRRNDAWRRTILEEPRGEKGSFRKVGDESFCRQPYREELFTIYIPFIVEVLAHSSQSKVSSIIL